MPPLKVGISLVDPYKVFKLSPINITFYTSRTAQEFYIGAPCGTPTGTYYLRFNIDDTTNFYSIPVIPVYIDQSETPGTATIQSELNSTIGGVQPIYINLSDYTVDLLTYSFTPNNLNTATDAVIADIQIQPFTNSSSGMFKVTSSSSTGTQKFNASKPNICFSPDSLPISFNLNLSPVVLSQNTNLQGAFSNYYNSDTDPSKKTPRNSIQFTFTPPSLPIFLYCALTCVNMDFPSDASIIAGSISSTPLTKLFIAYYGSSNSSVISWNNLVRGMQYKMRCIAQSTQFNELERSSATLQFDVFTSSSGSSKPITVSPPLTASCVTYSFPTNPSNSTKQALLNYCQNFFSIIPNPNTPTNSNPACIVCVDSDKNFTTGWTFTNNTQCIAPSVKRFLQSSSGSNSPASSSNLVYSVCPIQDLLCDNDNVTLIKSYNSYFAIDYYNSLKSSDDFKMILNISNVSIVGSTTVNDANPPLVTLTTSAGVFKAQTGDWSIVLSNPTTVSCYWKLVGNYTTVVTPSLGEIVSCSSTSACGNNIIVYSGTKITANSTNLVPLTQQYYSLFMVCYNYIPNAQMSSTVMNSWTFTTGVGPSSLNINNSTNQSGTNGTNSTNGTSSSTTDSDYVGKVIKENKLIILILLIFI